MQTVGRFLRAKLVIGFIVGFILGLLLGAQLFIRDAPTSTVVAPTAPPAIEAPEASGQPTRPQQPSGTPQVTPQASPDDWPTRPNFPGM